jgi:Flp pilus assembly protein TadG
MCSHYQRRCRLRSRGNKIGLRVGVLDMLRHLTKSFRRPTRALSRFCFAHDGATAVEFALIAPPFLALIVAIFQMTSFLFAQQALQTAAVAAGRLILTGQVQNAGLTQSQFKTNDVCPLLAAMFTCSNVYVNVQTYTDFCSAGTSDPTLTFNGSGAVTNTWSYNLGNPGQVVVMQLVYQWPIISGPLGSVLPNLGNGHAEMMGVTAFRVEPFQSVSN